LSCCRRRAARSSAGRRRRRQTHGAAKARRDDTCEDLPSALCRTRLVVRRRSTACRVGCAWPRGDAPHLPASMPKAQRHPAVSILAGLYPALEPITWKGMDGMWRRCSNAALIRRACERCCLLLPPPPPLSCSARHNTFACGQACWRGGQKEVPCNILLGSAGTLCCARAAAEGGAGKGLRYVFCSWG